MKQGFEKFQDKRMKIFGEIVKRYWSGDLKESKDLDALSEEIQKKLGLEKEDEGIIKDHIRVAMGLDPTGENEFKDEMDIIKNSHEVHEPIVTKINGVCEYCDEENPACKESCKYDAHIYRRNKGPQINKDKCLNCGNCVNYCEFGALEDKIEFVPLIDLLKDKDTDVYATVAPAIIGQFGEDVSMGQLRTALKSMGFKDMVEVALFADILTIKEALEFHHLVQNEEDVFLTSCCCPVWFSLVRKNYKELFEHMPPSVSPMIASGRVLKALYKDRKVKVVFISPCVAKKAEAKEPELKGDIDFVLTFRELKEVFEVLNIDLKSLPKDEKDQASLGGRIYARTGGVSFSVKSVVNRLDPARLIKLKAKKVNGVKNCKAVLDELATHKKVEYNFLEGMGCIGGCVGGPKTNVDKQRATELVNGFGEDSFIMTPFDNLNVMKILKEFGIERIEELTEDNELANLLKRQ